MRAGLFIILYMDIYIYMYIIYISLYINYISINIYICELVGYVHLKITLLDTGMT